MASILTVLSIPQWVACAGYIILGALCVAWALRFHRYALYTVPPLTIAVHGLIFYSTYFYDAAHPEVNLTALQFAWSPYLRIHGTFVFILMIVLMWDMLAAREKAAEVRRTNGHK